MTRERRVDERFRLHSPVEVAAVDACGEQFQEETRVEDISDAGCRFSLQHEVRPGAFVALRPLGEDGRRSAGEPWRLFVVMWMRQRGNGSDVGARGVRNRELMDLSPVQAEIKKHS